MFAVSSQGLIGDLLVVKSDDAATSVTLSYVGSNVRLKELATNRIWDYQSAKIGGVEFHGGAGNDRFVSSINVPVSAFGNQGNDYLQGGAGADYLLGGDGNDSLYGMGGDDRLNGQAGIDKMVGGDGNDILISIDAAFNEHIEGGKGADVIWADRSSSSKDKIVGNTTGDILQHIASFANGADRTLDGDRIADPTIAAGRAYRAFTGNPLFASDGPTMTDVRQGSVDDCWLLSGLGAVARDNPLALEQNIVDFDDGTYGVRLGDSFYRVDNDLPVANSRGSQPIYAALGAEKSMWVAVTEKAFAHYRWGTNNYASLAGGWAIEVNRAFRAKTIGDRSISSYKSAAVMAAEIAALAAAGQAVTIGFLGSAAIGGAPLVMNHMYTVAEITRNTAGTVASITLRNPWGIDGANNKDGNARDGLVTVTPAQIFAEYGRINWGRV